MDEEQALALRSVQIAIEGQLGHSNNSVHGVLRYQSQQSEKLGSTKHSPNLV
jgi:hypothetical protein